MSEAILIRGGRVIDPASDSDVLADVLVRDGVIAEIGPGLSAEGARTIDARGCVVGPGFVDLHAHLREPGFEQKGTIASETAAALRGGFTTVCDAGTRAAGGLQAVAAATRDVGIRCVLARICHEGPLQPAERFLATAAPLLHPSLAIAIPEAASDDMLHAVSRLCAESSAVFQIPFASSSSYFPPQVNPHHAAAPGRRADPYIAYPPARTHAAPHTHGNHRLDRGT